MKRYEVLIAFACLSLFPAAAAKSQVLRGDVVSREIRSEDDVAIIYDFTGVSGEEYEVSIFLVWGPASRIKLEKVRGDVGSGVAPGRGKVIHWDMAAEFPNPAEGTSYYFELEIRPVSGGWPWYYYAGGGVVAGVLTYVLIPSGSGEIAKPGNPSTIPLPPGATR